MKELLQMALDALESDPVPLNAINNASAFLRTALAAPQPEPVAWMREGWGPDCGPYTEIYTESEMTWRDRKQWTPLYAAPPAAPAPAVPLTDEQINDIWNAKDLPEHRSHLSPWGMDRIRAIIAAANGIGGGK